MREVLEAAVLNVVFERRDVADAVRVDAADDRPGQVCGAGDHHLAVHVGRCRHHPGRAADGVERRAPALEAALLAVHHHVGVVAEDLHLQVVAEAAHHAEHDGQRHHAEGDGEEAEQADGAEAAGAAGAEHAGRDLRHEARLLDQVEEIRNQAEREPQGAEADEEDHPAFGEHRQEEERPDRGQQRDVEGGPEHLARPRRDVEPRADGRRQLPEPADDHQGRPDRGGRDEAVADEQRLQVGEEAAGGGAGQAQVAAGRVEERLVAGVQQAERRERAAEDEVPEHQKRAEARRHPVVGHAAQIAAPAAGRDHEPHDERGGDDGVEADADDGRPEPAERLLDGELQERRRRREGVKRTVRREDGGRPTPGEARPAAHPASGRSSGNSSTSRIDGCPQRLMTSRSTPRPSPPAGGIPCISARM